MHIVNRWPSGISVIGLLLGSVVFTGWNSGNAFDGEQSSPTDQQGLSQSWDKKLPGTSRFTVLADFGGAAVRDNETGLVWEQSPDVIERVWERALDPLGATQYCVNKTVGGTVAWRLPSMVELKSVMDPTLPAPFLPNNVFIGSSHAR